MYHNFLDNIVDLSTPYYCYDLSLLRNTIGTIQKEISGISICCALCRKS